ncbi:MAG: hypothetical protein A2981_00920 [Candidatus Nealsonbacteria bacterium RIFCSPLOWO2_01_FULL_38_120]|nr:MAG: hypothetical protein A2981_00920 [Candidatus Nealsonbacteria bacterium RIFCSPLOWO2_01_FULL_38_120]
MYFLKYNPALAGLMYFDLFLWAYALIILFIAALCQIKYCPLLSKGQFKKIFCLLENPLLSKGQLRIFPIDLAPGSCYKKSIT